MSGFTLYGVMKLDYCTLYAYVDGQVDIGLSFSIDGVEYSMNPGMTWREWVESQYNTITEVIGFAGRLAIHDNEIVFIADGKVIAFLRHYDYSDNMRCPYCDGSMKFDIESGMYHCSSCDENEYPDLSRIEADEMINLSSQKLCTFEFVCPICGGAMDEALYDEEDESSGIYYYCTECEYDTTLSVCPECGEMMFDGVCCYDCGYDALHSVCPECGEKALDLWNYCEACGHFSDICPHCETEMDKILHNEDYEEDGFYYVCDECGFNSDFGLCPECKHPMVFDYSVSEYVHCPECGFEWID